MTDGPPVVTLLTQDACSLCDDAKAVLRRIAADRPLQTEEVALDSERGKALAAQGGVLFAPGVLLDGEPFGHGRLSEKKLRKAINAGHGPDRGFASSSTSPTP